MLLSFVIPCYRSEKTVKTVVDEIITTLKTRQINEYEIILVNDCSPDNVWPVISNLSENNNKIKGISLAKNFGQHSALLAGYAYCTGDYIVSLDDDGQAPLESLFQLIDKLEEGYDVVYAYYNEIKQTAFRRFGTFIAKKMEEVMLGVPKDFKGSSFYIARRFIVEEMVKYNNPFPFLFGLVYRTTHNIACIPTNHRKRLIGKSGYSFSKLFSLWINSFTAFSVKPLRLSALLGSITAFLGFVYAIITLIHKITHPEILVGYSSMMCVLLFIGGMIMMMLGLVGEYIGRIYICINNSPQYVIKELKNI